MQMDSIRLDASNLSQECQKIPELPSMLFLLSLDLHEILLLRLLGSEGVTDQRSAPSISEGLIIHFAHDLYRTFQP